ncbi:DUF806 family protein [Leuconostoc suionicum]|uniref:DUF806 family protein n=1 Tax=Leuconostoc suionicum TaxID=1511761 RepID=UPI0024AD27A8|nr:DUF806 family protein [Leuconostoc suionicum]MDI6503010.1 DUF806 family protein [Leuconostoc suionicum]MDI6665923.1 DUF806 family protein [Leuconostoc suionicum]
MTVVMDTFNLIKEHVTWTDGVYPKLIPKEVPASQTSLLIRDAYSNLGSYGNDTFNTIEQNVVIQIYYSTDSDLDYDDVEIELMKFLTANGYTINDIKGRQTDPDTTQDYQTIQVTRNKVIKEK